MALQIVEESAEGELEMESEEEEEETNGSRNKERRGEQELVNLVMS